MLLILFHIFFRKLENNITNYVYKYTREMMRCSGMHVCTYIWLEDDTVKALIISNQFAAIITIIR